MRTKVIFSICCLLIIAVCLAVLGVFWAIPRIHSIDGAEAAARAYVLAQTPIKHIRSVQWYTGGPLEITVTGTTYNGQVAYAFVNSGRATLAYGGQVVDRSRAVSAVYALHLPIQRIVSAVPGWVDPAYRTVFGRLAQGDAVWEIAAKLESGHFLFAYVDMYTGRLLWHYTTDATFRPWQQ